MRDGMQHAVADPLRAYADALLGAARSTSTAHAPLRLRVGGSRIALHFDGPASTGALLPAWRSLLDSGDAEPDAEFWIRTQSVSGRPPAVISDREVLPGAARTVVRSGAGVELELRAETGAVAMWDAVHGAGVWWGRRPEAISVSERVLPLGPLLRWALRSLGTPVIRAGVAGSTRGGLLIVAPRGAGCSTTVLAARRLGLAAIADEVVAIDPRTLAAHPVTGFATVGDRSLRLLPELMGRLAQLPRTNDGKRAVLLDERPLRLAEGMPLRAVVVPSVAAATGVGRLLEDEEAEAMLTRSTLPQHPPTGPADEPLPAFVRGLPTFVVPVGPQPDAIANALVGVLRDLD